MSKVYVTKVEDTYRVEGTRISLDSLVYLYREGISPEGMVESYPTLTLEQVHGALAYYLAISNNAGFVKCCFELFLTFSSLILLFLSILLPALPGALRCPPPRAWRAGSGVKRGPAIFAGPFIEDA
jgi:hypothetical protein